MLEILGLPHKADDGGIIHPRTSHSENESLSLLRTILVHAEKVDLHHLLGLGVNANMGRHRRDEANKFVALSYPHPAMPLLTPLTIQDSP